MCYPPIADVEVTHAEGYRFPRDCPCLVWLSHPGPPGSHTTSGPSVSSPSPANHPGNSSLQQSQSGFSTQWRNAGDQVITKALDLARPAGHHTEHSSSEDPLLSSSGSLLAYFFPQLHYSWLPRADEYQRRLPRPKTTDPPGNINHPWSSREIYFVKTFRKKTIKCLPVTFHSKVQTAFGGWIHTLSYSTKIIPAYQKIVS